MQMIYSNTLYTAVEVKLS